MTNQEAFDKMLAHLRSLKVRSTNGRDECVYNGRKCAIGALMTDEEQEKFGDFRGSVFALLSHMKEAGHSSALADLDANLLGSMQSMHDSRASWWRKDGFANETKAERIAVLFGLVYTAR